MVCTKCGKNNPDDSKFCVFCGTPIVIQNDTQTIETTQQNIDNKGELEKSTVCPSCGEELGEFDTYCTKCGKVFTNPKRTEPALSIAILLLFVIILPSFIVIIGAPFWIFILCGVIGFIAWLFISTKMTENYYAKKK